MLGSTRAHHWAVTGEKGVVILSCLKNLRPDLTAVRKYHRTGWECCHEVRCHLAGMSLYLTAWGRLKSEWKLCAWCGNIASPTVSKTLVALLHSQQFTTAKWHPDKVPSWSYCHLVLSNWTVHATQLAVDPCLVQAEPCMSPADPDFS